MKKQNYIAIKVEGMNGQAVIRCNANKDMELASPDGSKKIGLGQGEVFYLAISESLGEGWYYVVVMATEVGREGWRCQCSSCKPCKHERAVNTSLRERFRIQTNREYEAYRESVLAAVKAIGAMALVLGQAAGDIQYAKYQAEVDARNAEYRAEKANRDEEAYNKRVAWLASPKREAKGVLNGSSQGFSLLK